MEKKEAVVFFFNREVPIEEKGLTREGTDNGNSLHSARRAEDIDLTGTSPLDQ